MRCKGSRSALVALLLGGVASAATPALAQDGAAAIEQRIEAVFKIVPRNPAELAIPLTRRALARRSVGEDHVAPLAYRPTGEIVVEAAPPVAASSPGAVPEAGLDSVQELSIETAEAGTAEELAEGDAEFDEDVARLPRPRPSPTGEEEVAAVALPQDARNAALDLVAGAAPDPRQDQTAAAAEPAEPEFDGPVAEKLPRSVEAVAFREPEAPPAIAASAEPAVTGTVRPDDSAAMADCVQVDKLADADKDFARNADALAAPGFCLRQEKFKERRRPWTVQTVDSGRPGPLWAVMHDDEDVAFDSAVDGLATYGGVLFTVDTGGKRNQDGIDPNRNFSDAEISCPKAGKAASPRFTGTFAKLIDPAQPIIALHSNFNGRVPTTGIGHVSMSTVPKKMRVAKSNDPDGPLASERALVLLAAGEPASETVDGLMASLSAKGVNVVLETVGEQGDCSLSNYAVLSGHQRYFNVTVHYDEGDKQKRIVEAILSKPARIAAAE